jgi:hypothetical protein
MEVPAFKTSLVNTHLLACCQLSALSGFLNILANIRPISGRFSLFWLFSMGDSKVRILGNAAAPAEHFPSGGAAPVKQIGSGD